MSAKPLDVDDSKRQKDSWHTVWVAYERASTPLNVLSTILMRAPALPKLLVVSGLVLFMGGFLFSGLAWMRKDQDDALCALFVMGASEFALLHILGSMKSVLAQEFGSKEAAYQPPERERHINT